MAGTKKPKPMIWDIYNADVFFEDKKEKKTRPVLLIDEINNMMNAKTKNLIQNLLMDENKFEFLPIVEREYLF